MMAVLYGALNAALDTTAGERERGSLEPLLMNPAERWALVAGKWGAVACVERAVQHRHHHEVREHARDARRPRLRTGEIAVLDLHRLEQLSETPRNARLSSARSRL